MRYNTTERVPYTNTIKKTRIQLTPTRALLPNDEPLGLTRQTTSPTYTNATNTHSGPFTPDTPVSTPTPIISNPQPSAYKPTNPAIPIELKIANTNTQTFLVTNLTLTNIQIQPTSLSIQLTRPRAAPTPSKPSPIWESTKSNNLVPISTTKGPTPQPSTYKPASPTTAR